MAGDHAEVWIQAPPAPVQNLDALIHNPSPEHEQEKVPADDMLLMGMMLWMEQGLVLEWLQPGQEKQEEERRAQARRRSGASQE